MKKAICVLAIASICCVIAANVSANNQQEPTTEATQIAKNEHKAINNHKKTPIHINDNKRIEISQNAINTVIVKRDKQIVIAPKMVIYDPNDLTKPSNVTYNQLYNVLRNTALEGLTYSFIEAEKRYNVNALFLAGLAATESTWGTSRRAIEQNNLVGHGVYLETSRGSNFSSKEQSILKTAKMLSVEYLNEKGECYNGKSIWAVNRKYSLHPNKTVNTEWSNIINEIAIYDIKNKIK